MQTEAGMELANIAVDMAELLVPMQEDALTIIEAEVRNYTGSLNREQFDQLCKLTESAKRCRENLANSKSLVMHAIEKDVKSSRLVAKTLKEETATRSDLTEAQRQERVRKMDVLAALINKEEPMFIRKCNDVFDTHLVRVDLLLAQVNQIRRKFLNS